MTNETAIQVITDYVNWHKNLKAKQHSPQEILDAFDCSIEALTESSRNKHILDTVKEQYEEEKRLRDKYEGKQNGYRFAHRAMALRDLLKKIAVLLLISGSLSAQKRENFWLKQGISATTMFAAGWLSATNEVANSDYRRYAARHPNADPKWANPRVGFRNKYVAWPTDKRPAYIGSKTFLAWTTDRHHLTNTTRNFLIVGNIGITMSLYDKPNWKQIGLQALTSWAAFAVGSGAAHRYYKYVD